MTIFRLVLLLSSFFVCSSAIAQDYEIKLKSRARVGDKIEVIASVTISDNMKMVHESRVIKETRESTLTRLEGVKEILASSAPKKESKVLFTVARFTAFKVGAHGEKDLLPKGTKFIAQRNGNDIEYLIDGKPLAPDVAKKLGQFSLVKIGGVSDHQLFSPKERKKVGEIWPINKDAVAKFFESFGNKGLKVDIRDVDGASKLEQTLVKDGATFLYVIGQMNVKKVVFPLPPGVEIEKTSVYGVYTAEIPVDISVGCGAHTFKMSAQVLSRGRLKNEGPLVNLEANFESLHETKQRLLNP